MLYSIRHRHRGPAVRQGSELQPLPSVAGIWPAADWPSAGVDMFGLNITGHPIVVAFSCRKTAGLSARKDYPLEGRASSSWRTRRLVEVETGQEEADID
jgi:NADH:ubiquinone oxidoreductase subunit C